jgi:glucosamine kinase
MEIRGFQGGRMAELFIGVDGGASRCRVRVADGAGRALGEAEGGPANIGLGRVAWDNILAACRAAARAAGLSESDLGRVHAGMGLAGVISDRLRRETESEPHPFASLAVDSDAYAALLGAHEGRDGAVLILGTGSCGLALVNGVRHIVGGWGADISDEASGAVIAKEAVRRALWAHDGLIKASPLTGELLAFFEGRPENAVEWARKARTADFAKLAPRVFDHAQAGDSIAADILVGAARDAERMIAGLRALGAKQVSLVGGLAKPMEEWLAPDVRAQLVLPVRDAIDGAILLAQQRAKAGVPSQ